MTDSLKKLPNWVIQLLVNILVLAFFAGGAYKTFAEKSWVEDKIEARVSRVESEQDKTLQRIEDTLKRIEERQYEEAKKRR